VEDDDWRLFEDGASEQAEEVAQGEGENRLRLAHRVSGQMYEPIPVLHETDASQVSSYEAATRKAGR
jgi:hypothetical protein